MQRVIGTLRSDGLRKDRIREVTIVGYVEHIELKHFKQFVKNKPVRRWLEDQRRRLVV